MTNQQQAYKIFKSIKWPITDKPIKFLKHQMTNQQQAYKILKVLNDQSVTSLQNVKSIEEHCGFMV